SNFSASHFP
ncbi:hypothetical protein D020_0163B, partial [Vibrio parahaemolyticus SBR10290]